jgi:hypothetical protein
MRRCAQEALLRISTPPLKLTPVSLTREPIVMVLSRW